MRASIHPWSVPTYPTYAGKAKTRIPFDSQYIRNSSRYFQYFSFGVVKSGASVSMSLYTNDPFQCEPFSCLRKGRSLSPLKGGWLPRGSWVIIDISMEL